MSELSDSIHNKRMEIKYNEKTIKNKEKKSIKIDLKGKIRCPVLNANISSTVCSNLMDKEGWPRCIKSEICQEAGCFINLSIKHFNDQKRKDDAKEPKNQT